MISFLARKLASLDENNCILDEPSQKLALKVKRPETWIPINAKLSELADRAVLAEVIRLWIADKGWSLSHSPCYKKEHVIVIETQYPAVKKNIGQIIPLGLEEKMNFATINESYTQALFETYINALIYARSVDHVS